jgi:hypothetical protein
MEIAGRDSAEDHGHEILEEPNRTLRFPTHSQGQLILQIRQTGEIVIQRIDKREFTFA